MATSSLTHNFIIKDKKAVKRFVDILTDENGPRMERHPELVKHLNEEEALLLLRKIENAQ